MSPDQRSGVPLYQQVKQTLKASIARGEYRQDIPFITERKVRERFGVSTTTAIKALNELVAEGVLVRKQGRGTFVAERSGADGRTPRQVDGQVRVPVNGEKTMACILQGHGPHIGEILRGAEATAASLGYRLFLTHCDDDPEREGAALRNAMESGVDGIVLYPAEGNANADLFTEIQRRRMPLVLVDRYRIDMATDAVVADNIAVGHEVTTHLIEMGHRTIATLWDEIDCTSVRDRLTGHLQALREQDIPIRPDLTVLKRYVDADPNRPGVVASLLADPEPPTVLLCANGYALAHAVNDLAELGDAAAGSVELAGMDDAGPYDILPLTTVSAKLPSREIGEEAVRLLDERISSGNPSRDVQRKVLPIQIRTRESAPGYLRVVAAPSSP